MRIIAGELKGREIRLPKNSRARPLTGRALEQVMSLLKSKLSRGPFLDLCAGSGIAGFEALSRGATKVVFVETDGQAASNIRRQITDFEVGDRAFLLKADVRRCAKRVLALLEAQPATSCLLDAPFIKGMADDLLGNIGYSPELFAPGAILICRSPDTLAEQYGFLTLAAKHAAGNATMWVYSAHTTAAEY